MENQSNREEKLKKEYLNLRDYFGHANLRMDLQQEITEETDNDSLFVNSSKLNYMKVRLTHVPTGKVVFGTSYNTQIENSIEALKKLKNELE